MRKCLGMEPNWKPEKGTARRAHRARQRKVNEEERRRKEEARQRDSYKCRWPRCSCRKRKPVEACHLVHKGAGGDPQLVRTRVDLLISFCADRHRGTPSLDGGDLAVEFLTDENANGPCEFYQAFREVVDGVATTRWELVGRERAIHVLE